MLDKLLLLQLEDEFVTYGGGGGGNNIEETGVVDDAVCKRPPELVELVVRLLNEPVTVVVIE